MTGNDKLVKQAFERPQWYLSMFACNIRIRIETVKFFVDDARNKRFLDIGCGDGSVSLHLLGEDNRITLLDRSKRMLEIALSHIPGKLAGRVEVVNEDFMAAHLPAQSFDSVICVGVLAYIDNLRPFVDKVASVLAPGGRVIVECSDGEHFIGRVSRAYDRLRRRLGATDFDTVCRPGREVMATFRDLGFELSGSFRYSWTLPVIRRLLPQAVLYRAVRLIYGTAAHNRFPSLGSECIFHFKRVE